MTASREILCTAACTLICRSTGGIFTQPGQIALHTSGNAAASSATNIVNPIISCLAAT